MALKEALTPDPNEVDVTQDEVPEETEVTEAEVEQTEGEQPTAETPVEEAEEPVEESTEEAPAPKPVAGESERERALRLEVQRLKGELRSKERDIPSVPVKPEEEDDEAVGKAEALFLNSLQEDAFQSFLDEHPAYRKDDKLWDKFLVEYNDRRPVHALAKKQGKTVNRRMIKERLDSIHRSVLGDTSIDTETRKMLQTKAKASVHANQSTGGAPASVQPKKKIFIRRITGISSWATK